MADEAQEKEGQEGEEGSKGGSKKKLIIIAAVLVVLLIGVGGFLFLSGGKRGEEGEEALEEEHNVHYERADLGVFVVNLSDNATFLKVRLVVEYDPAVIMAEGGGGHGGGFILYGYREIPDDIAKEWGLTGYGRGGEYGGGAAGGEGEEGLPGLLGEKEPLIKDAIIRVLSSKRAEEVLTVEGKEQLKEELVAAINETLGLEEDGVVNVYFTEFIIQ